MSRLKIDAGGYCPSINQAGASAREAERIGYDGWSSAETQVDPFLACAVAVERTRSLEVGTAVAIAFARNPMTVALQANDLQALSAGRFVLGLGSQIQPHITRRYSMVWSQPAARMREFVLAIRAIWDAWATGQPLDFRGEFYTHTLMTPFFSPGPNPHGNPKIMLGAVGPLMTEVAGEVADGLVCHPFTTERYIREVTIPALERGRASIGKTLDGFEISGPVFVVARESESEISAGVESVKQQIAFYGSTAAYRPVLELHGLGSLQDDLNAMARRGEWSRMPSAIDDDVLNTFAVVGSPEAACTEIQTRYGDLLTRITLTVPEGRDGERRDALLDALRSRSVP